MEIDWKNKNVKLVFKRNDFILFGIILEQDNNGIIFKTDQKTSFVSWDAIKELQEVD